MANYAVNGVPLFGPAQAVAEHHRGWLRTDDPLAVVDSLRDVSRAAERIFGVGLQPLLLDFVTWVRSGRAPLPLSVASIAVELDAAPGEVKGLVQAMARAGLLRIVAGGGEDGDALVEPTALHAAALEQFEQMLDGAFVSRTALRRALLVNRIADPALAGCVQRIFDRFFDLGWLYLHNWAGTCPMMATLVAEALRAEGCATQVLMGSFDVVLEGKAFSMGRIGRAYPGKLDGHVFCVAEGRAVVDFALGNMRRHFRRDYPWALAADCDAKGAVLASLHHERAGAVRWAIDWDPPGGDEQLARARPLAAEMMQVYALPPGGGRD